MSESLSGMMRRLVWADEAARKRRERLAWETKVWTEMLEEDGIIFGHPADKCDE